VRLDAGIFVLVHGDREVAVRVVDRTHLGFNGEPIESLQPIARALEAGIAVWAMGEGVVREDGDMVLALWVRFKTRPENHEVRFGGRVREIDPERGLVAIVEGPVVKVGPDTRMAVNGEPIESLDRLAEALDAGHAVYAFGEGRVEAGTDVVLAAFIRFEVEDGDPAHVSFAGRVASVNLDARSFRLVDGPTIQLTNETQFADRSAVTSLDAVAEALARGAVVFAEGRGEVASTEPRVIVAVVLAFRIED
jgi:hypothetical protein